MDIIATTRVGGRGLLAFCTTRNAMVQKQQQLIIFQHHQGSPISCIITLTRDAMTARSRRTN
jgi:hypothetical protein